MLRWILKNIEIAVLEKNDLRKIEIASEETLVNIINHAYQGRVNGVIQINIAINKEGIELKFFDNGPEFNPIEEKSLTEKNMSLEERSLGGLGLMMIRQYMDDIVYERKGSVNILTLVKHINY